MIRKALLLLATTIAAISTFASETNEEKRPIFSTYALEAGSGQAIDTYLSPMRYTGPHIALSGDWTKALPFGRDLSMSITARLEGMRMRSPARNSLMWQGAANFSWLLRRGWHITNRLTLSAGGGSDLYAGALYLPRNSNNPATAKAEISLQGSFSASYRLQLGTLPITLRNSTRTPVLGILFSQDYGQPYYNIYLGNRSRLIHTGWWGNNFCIDNLLSTTMHFGNGDLGIAYRFRLYSTHVCNLNTKILSHAAVIQWTPARHQCTSANIRTPLY